MSDNNKFGGAEDDTGSNQDQTNNAQVSRKAYEEVTRDLHKNKQKAKELELAYNELQAQLKAQEELKMQEQEKWKELYQKRDAEIAQIKQEAKTREASFHRVAKLAALKQELGGKIKDKYLNFANIDSIIIGEDGLIEPGSLHEVANQFRTEHSDLIPKSDNMQITGHAAGNFDNFNEKPINQMSYAEKVKKLQELELQKAKKQ